MASKHIPKIIHQSFYSKKLPKEVEENIEKIKRLNPDWEYRFYDDNDIQEFIEERYGKPVLELYYTINPKYGAARADLFRYLLINDVGGVWLDIKSTMNKPLDDVLKEEDKFIISQWQNKLGEPYQGWGLAKELQKVPGGEFQQWHIISMPRHPFMMKVINHVLKNLQMYRGNPKISGLKGALICTGPVAYTQAIFPLLSKYEYRIVDIHNDLNIDYTIYSSKYTHRRLSKNYYAKNQEPIVIGNN